MSEPNAGQAIAELIAKAQKEITSALGATNQSQGSEPVPPQPVNDHSAGQPTEKNLNGEEAKKPEPEQPPTTAEGFESKKDEGASKGAVEVGAAAGVDHGGETTKEGESAQIGEKRAHPEDTAVEKGEGDEGAEGQEAKKLKTDESKQAEEETEETKGKGGKRKSTRKTTATTKSTAATEGKKRSVGRPRKNAAPEKNAEEKKDEGGEQLEAAQPTVAAQPTAEIN